MWAILKGVVVEPSATFRDIDQTSTLGQAAAVVILAGGFSRVPMLAGVREPQPLGIALLLLLGIASYSLIWFLLGTLSHLVARRIFGGQGTLKITLTAFGFAHVILVLRGLANSLLVSTSFGDGPISLFFQAWHIVLLVIALRETHDLPTLRASASLAIGGIAPLFLAFHLTMGVFYVSPYIKTVPWEESPSPTWEDAPPGAANLVSNPGFEDLDKDAATPGAPLGWKPYSAKFPFGRTILHRDLTNRHTGAASALVLRTGVKIGWPLGWTQEIKIPPTSVEWIYLATWMRTENATSAAAMLTFRNEQGRVIAIANTSPITGTNDWQEHRIKAKVPPGATTIIIGAHLWGAGKLWIDDVRLFLEPAQKASSTPEPAD